MGRRILTGFRRSCSVLALCLATELSSHAQAGNAKIDAADPSSFAFEVATIKPAAPSPDGHNHINYPTGGRFSAINMTLLGLMAWAWDVPSRQILDGPPWLSSTYFDIQAKTDAATDARLRALPPETETEAKRHMVQSLLTDRYGLTLHHETRTLPAYDLVIAKGGSKLQASTFNGKNIWEGRNYIRDQGVTTAILADQLARLTGRVVVDKTNLAERYDITIRWTPDDAPVNDDPNAPPGLMTSIQEQIGLKLEPAKEPVPVLVIDQIQKPSDN